MSKGIVIDTSIMFSWESDQAHIPSIQLDHYWAATALHMVAKKPSVITAPPVNLHTTVALSLSPFHSCWLSGRWVSEFPVGCMARVTIQGSNIWVGPPLTHQNDKFGKLKLRILGCCRFSKFPDTPQGVTLVGNSSGTTLCVGPLSGIKWFHSSSYSGSSKGCYNVVTTLWVCREFYMANIESASHGSTRGCCHCHSVAGSRGNESPARPRHSPSYVRRSKSLIG